MARDLLRKREAEGTGRGQLVPCTRPCWSASFRIGCRWR